MTLLELAYKLRPIIEKAMESLDDQTALDAVSLFPNWGFEKRNTETGIAEPIKFEFGFRVRHNSILYKCITTHTAQQDWAPDLAPSLWAKVLIPDDEEIYHWVQPDSTNPYMTGDRVIHNEKTWISDIDNNVWEPGIYGWSEVI